MTPPQCYIGSPLERIDDERLLSAVSPLHAAILRSSIAHRMTIDASAAHSRAGIAEVMPMAVAQLEPCPLFLPMELLPA